MRAVMAILFRCVLALGLGFTPVANAFDMATLTAAPHSREDAPPCHAHSQTQDVPDSKCHGGAGHCHCSIATALPAESPVITHTLMPPDHPQTARRLTLEHPLSPDTPPPRT